MKKALLILAIGAILIILSIAGNFLKVGHMEETGWEDSDYPFWLTMIGWGFFYCLLLWFKKLHPKAHPILWLIGIIPLFVGIYILVKVMEVVS
jgi:hypothetical protein